MQHSLLHQVTILFISVGSVVGIILFYFFIITPKQDEKAKKIKKQEMEAIDTNDEADSRIAGEHFNRQITRKKTVVEHAEELLGGNDAVYYDNMR